jgi:hypothetical protein
MITLYFRATAALFPAVVDSRCRRPVQARHPANHLSVADCRQKGLALASALGQLRLCRLGAGRVAPGSRPPLYDDRDFRFAGLSRGTVVANRPEIRSLCTDSPSLTAREIGELQRTARGELLVPAGGRDLRDAARLQRQRRRGRDRTRPRVKRFGIADASVIPIAPSAITHLPTIVLAERIRAIRPVV